MATFRAVRIDKGEQGQTAKLVDFDDNDLMDGDVTVRVEWSTVNYKDGLAISGKAPVVRRFPMIPGIDFVGMVESSTHADWKPGDRVILNGWGVGETHLGGYAEKARVKGDWLVPAPAGMTGREAMATEPDPPPAPVTSTSPLSDVTPACSSPSTASIAV